MAKTRSTWVCQECGYQSTGYLGKCTDCGSWGTLVEEKIVSEEPSGKKERRARLAPPATVGTPQLLSEIETLSSSRIPTGIADLDEVLGGGLVPGSVVLLAGDPGIGKSTLLLQVAKNVSGSHDVLYVAGEESASQVQLRATRLGMVDSRVFIDARHDVCDIAERLAAWQSGIAIVDSIQSVFDPQLSSAPGSVSQVRESAQLIISAAKAVNTATIIVGHVTKDGSIAGPRVLEHMVDVVLQFEGDRARQLRILRAVKNRFGSTQEAAIFSMSDRGLQAVDNPSALLLGERLNLLGKKQAPSGTAVIATGEGNRILLLEVQALVSGTSQASPRRVGNGWDGNRLLQIAAVLEKKVGINLSRSDLYVNVVGGLEIDDPAGDLGVAAAIATSSLDRSVDPGTVFIGEIGLTGEVRSVTGLDRRVREARRLGFTRAIVPRSALKLEKKAGFEIVEVESVSEALATAIPNLREKAREDFSPAAKKGVSPSKGAQAFDPV
ncbi:MAG: DNA repair protein RadA [Candidatus Obscuribacterales bacterium]